MTTKEDIREWLERGVEEKATHVIVVCDTYDWEDYPVNVSAGEDIQKVIVKYNGPNMQKIMEVYKLSMDLEEQLSAKRAFNC